MIRGNSPNNRIDQLAHYNKKPYTTKVSSEDKAPASEKQEIAVLTKGLLSSVLKSGEWTPVAVEERISSFFNDQKTPNILKLKVLLAAIKLPTLNPASTEKQQALKNALIAVHHKNGISSNKLQRFVKKDLEKLKTKHEKNQAFIGPSEKKVISEVMQKLQDQIKYSSSAYEDNKIVQSGFSRADKGYLSSIQPYLQNFEKDESMLSRYNDFLNRLDIAHHGENLQVTKSEVEDWLNLLFDLQQMNCQDLAMYMVNKLIKNEYLSAEIKDNIQVAHVGTHVFCLIGSPDNPDSVVIDPWIFYRYIENGTEELISPVDPERRTGFIGTVAQYTEFLQHQESKYINPQDLKVHVVKNIRVLLENVNLD